MKELPYHNDWRLLLAQAFHNRIRPKIGKRIKITWLPTNNGYPYANAYIGMSGTVKEHYRGSGFCLDTGGSFLIVNGPFYRYKYLTPNQ